MMAARRPAESGPLVVWEMDGHRGERVRACCAAAGEAGVRPGLPLAEARLLLERVPSSVGQVSIVRDDAEQDRLGLLDEAEQGWRFTPLVGISEETRPRSILGNVTGCAHLCGGEQGLARDMQACWAGRGYQVRVAIAGSIGLAMAVAYAAQLQRKAAAPLVVPAGDERKWLERMPVESLRFDQQVVEDLRELSLRTVGQLLSLPDGSWRSRFGDGTVRRIQEALGERPEPLQCLPFLESVSARQDFEHPVRSVEIVECQLRGLVERVVQRVWGQGRGVLKLVCQVEDTAQSCQAWEVRMIEGVREAGHVWELVRLQLQSRRLPTEVTRLEVIAEEVVILRPRQETLFESEEGSRGVREVSRLVERLGSRLGQGAVLQPRANEELIPEHAGELLSADCELLRDWPSGRETTRWQPGPAARPLRLVPDPVAVELVSVGREGPPVRFYWQDRLLHVVRHWGPERIETGWWRQTGVARDYYRVETSCGEWFWLFRQRDQQDWFLHGVFE